MLYDERAVRDNIRNREGKRVFYLGKGHQLTSQARDYLNRERIEILPAHMAKPERYRLLTGGYVEEKPEHMTHLSGDVLVEKTHPRIVFRGAIDCLEAELLLCISQLPQWKQELSELLSLARRIIQADVLGQPLEEKTLCGLSSQQLREQSHRPQDFFGQPHFMPEASDGLAVLQLNKLRTLARQAEIKAVAAMPAREDILRTMNRMSSFLYILMLRQKTKVTAD